MPRDYLLIPVPPTPNGRLHLGHMAGPYLRMDALKRRLMQRGHTAALWTGTDSHDSFILHRAFTSGLTPTQVCDKYFGPIRDDLAAMDVAVDGFVDTLRGKGRELQESFARASVDRLLATGHAVALSEPILFDAENQMPVVGTWQRGRCPRCGAECVGYFCEGCFTHNQPGELLDASSRHPDARLVGSTIETVFLDIVDPAAFLRLLESMEVGPRSLAVVAAMLEPPVRRFRLTVPIGWGLGYGDDRHGHPRSIFEVLWEIHTYGELHAAARGGGVPAWRRGSETDTIVACGVDNTIAILMGGMGVFSALPECKPPAHAHVNFFMKLNGSKFSTNRNHAIWSGDLANLLQNRVDSLRYFLFLNAPDTTETDFRVAEFVDFHNRDFLDGFVPAIARAFEDADAREDQALRDHLSAALAGQDEALRPGRVSLSAVARALSDWMALETRLPRTSMRTWLTGVTLLGAPVMPTWSAAIQRSLGYADGPAWLATEPMTSQPAAWRSPALPPKLVAGDVEALIGRPP